MTTTTPRRKTSPPDIGQRATKLRQVLLSRDAWSKAELERLLAVDTSTIDVAPLEGTGDNYYSLRPAVGVLAAIKASGLAYRLPRRVSVAQYAAEHDRRRVAIDDAAELLGAPVEPILDAVRAGELPTLTSNEPHKVAPDWSVELIDVVEWFVRQGGDEPVFWILPPETTDERLAREAAEGSVTAAVELRRRQWEAAEAETESSRLEQSRQDYLAVLLKTHRGAKLTDTDLAALSSSMRDLAITSAQMDGDLRLLAEAIKAAKLAPRVGDLREAADIAVEQAEQLQVQIEQARKAVGLARCRLADAIRASDVLPTIFAGSRLDGIDLDQLA